MMRRTPRGPVVLSVMMVLIGACSESSRNPAPTQPPAAAPATPTPPSPPPDVTFPALTRPGRVYGTPVSLTGTGLLPITLRSRYVLYDNRQFALQYAPATGNMFEYTGTYSDSDDEIQFQFADFGGGSQAIGSLRDDLLTVRYTIDMQMADFEDAVYTLTESVGSTATTGSR